MITKQEISAGIQTIKAIAEAIRDAGSIPSGNLYSIVMGKLSLSQFETIIGILKRSQLVSESNNLLTWKGATLL